LEPGGPMRFRTTRWSLVRAAQEGTPDAAQAALRTLCQDYWYPLFVFVRAEGYGEEEARDLTQEFFMRFLEQGFLKNATPEGGKFRSYLIGAMKHFLMNEARRGKAQKRGGGLVKISLDSVENEASPAIVDSKLSPERQFERQWALTVLDRSLRRLESIYSRKNRGHEFAALRTLLTGERGKIPYVQLAEELSTTEGAIKTAAHRMRARYGELVRDEVRQTVAEGEDVET